MKTFRALLLCACCALISSFAPSAIAQPHLEANNPLTISQGGTAFITTSYLDATDSEVGASGIIFILGSNNIDGGGGPPREGVLLNNGAPMGNGSTFTMDDINNYRITYQQTTNDCNSNDDFECSLTNSLGEIWSDQGHTSFTFHIAITLIDRPPVASNSSAVVSLGESFSGTCIGVNPDCLNQTLTYSLATLPAKGTVTSFDTNTGAFTYQATVGSSGNDSFTFQVSDGVQNAAQPGTISVSIQVQPPSASGASFTTPEDVTFNGTLPASDPNTPPQPLTYTLLSSGSLGTATVINSSTGAFSYVPQPGRFGYDSFTFKVNNGAYDSGTATVSMTLAPRGLSQGNLLISDSRNKFLALINPANSDAVACSMGGLIANPTGVAYEASGTVLINDQNNGVIRVNPSTGAQTALISHSVLPFPIGIAEEAGGAILVADVRAGLFRFSNAGALVTNFPAGSLVAPAGVAVATNGQIFVVDAGFFVGQPAQNKVVQIDPVTLSQTIITSGGLLTSPVSIALEPDGNILSAQLMANSLVRITYPGAIQSTLSSGGNFQSPFGVGVDKADNIYVTGQMTNTLTSVNATSGAQTTVAPFVQFSSLGLAVVGPSAPPSITNISAIGAGQYQVHFSSAVGSGNTVLATTNLTVPLTNWTVLGSATENFPGSFQFTDTTATNLHARYYKVRSP